MVNPLISSIAILALLECIYACTNIFAYSDDYQSGTFEVDGVVDSRIETTIQLSVADILSQSNTGTLKTQNYDVLHTLSTTGKLYYIVKFPISRSVPRVTMITTNGRLICTGEPYHSLQRTTIKLSHTYTSTIGHNSRFGNQHMPGDGFHMKDDDVFSMSDENPFIPPIDNQVLPSYRRHTTSSPNFGLFLNIGDQRDRSNGSPPLAPRRPQPDDPMRRNPNGVFATVGSPPFDNRGQQQPTDGFTHDNRPFVQQPNRNAGLNWGTPTGPGFDPSHVDSSRRLSNGRTNTNEQSGYRPDVATQSQPANRQPYQPNLDFDPSYVDSSRRPSIGRPSSNEHSGFRPDVGTQDQPANRQPYQPNRGMAGPNHGQPVAPQNRPSTRTPAGCGTVVHGLSSHIYHGESIPYGSWPWLVPLFQANSPDMRYLCGGTLVSPRAVITSAHCFDEANNLDLIYVVVGRFNLLDWTDRNSTIIKVNVTVHPHYRKNDANFDADIAVLHLLEEAIINDYVRPACVWERTILIDDIVNKSGVVAGWGQTEEGVYSTLPKQIMTNVVSNEACFSANPTLQSLTTGRNFCAGKLDGTGPCRGDSGGGLLFNVNGRWTLRGIVSAIINTKIRDCDLSNYVVYADVAQFHDWLDSLI